MARVFNGTSDLIAANAAHLTNGGAGVAFTVAAWVNKTAHVNDMIYGEAAAGAAGPFFQFNFDGTTGQHLTFGARSATSGSADVITGLLPLTDGVWHHACITQNANNVALFVDGTADTTGTRTSLSNSTQTFNTATIGALVRNTTASFYSGSIVHVATWRRQLSAAEVALLASGTLPSALAAGAANYYWPLLGQASPEPDIGTDGEVDGTLTGTTASTGLPPQIGLATFNPSLGRRPVPMIKGPDKDTLLGMRGNSF